MLFGEFVWSGIGVEFGSVVGWTLSAVNVVVCWRGVFCRLLKVICVWQVLSGAPCVVWLAIGVDGGGAWCECVV